MIRVHTHRQTDVETWDEAHYLVRLEFELVRGLEIVVDSYTVYDNDELVDGSDETVFTVEDSYPRQLAEDLRNTTDEYVDPYWDLTAVNPAALGSLAGPWCFGPSYRVLEAVREDRRVEA